MKAILIQQYGGPEVLKLCEIPDPTPGAGQVVVDVRAAGVNPVDTYLRSGNYPLKIPTPYVPGSDAAGVVSAVGQGVSRWKIGDRVWTIGSANGRLRDACAQKMLCNADQLYRLPERISFAQGAALHVPYASAYRALFDRAQAQPGDVVLIHGATGAVGLAAVEFAQARGCTVIGTGGSDAGRTLLRDKGVALVLDHTRTDYLSSVKSLAPDGPNVILEMLANVNLQRDMEIAAPHGRIVIIGNRGTIEINPRLAMGKELNIQGMQLWAAGDQPVDRACRAIVAGLEAGFLSPTIQRELPLADAAEAHRLVIDAPSGGKIVLIV
jgi:NADPH2:quinone reductase